MKEKQVRKPEAFRFRKFARKNYAAFNSLRKVVNIGVMTGCLLTAMLTKTASAQEIQTGQQQKVLEQELEEVMVTAAKVETPLNQSARLVTVITKEDIQRAPVQSIQDLLIYSANIDVLQRGGHGVQADISIRGGSSDQSAILLNGVNLTNAQTGHYSFDIPINLSDIERIEIIHGPSALIYGASAFSGGINIITKKDADTRLYGQIEAGMHNLHGVEMRGTARTGLATHTLSAGYQSSDGYIGNSDYNLYNLLWQTRLNLKERDKIDFSFGYNEKKYGANTFYSPAYPDQYDHTRSFNGSVKGDIGSVLKVIPIVYFSRHHDDFQLIRGTDTGRNLHRNDTYGANLIFTYRSVLGTTSLGTEIRREDVISSGLGKPMSVAHRKYTRYDGRTNSSVAFEHTASWNRFLLSAGVLMNHTTMLNGKYKFYPSLNLSYRPVDPLQLYTSWSKSTRMPTFTDLYGSAGTHAGNEDLKPEYSQSWDIGLKYRSRFINAYLTGFFLWGSDIIDWVKSDPTDDSQLWQSWNLTKIKTRGIEGGVKFRLGERLPVLGERSVLNLDYARMHQDSDTKEMYSKYTLNYLRDKFTVKFNHRIVDNLYMDWFFRYQKRMGTYEYYENHTKTGELRSYPAFSTLDVRLSYQMKDINFHLTMNNLYNTSFFDLGSIPQPGFWLMGGVSYTLK